MTVLPVGSIVAVTSVTLWNVCRLPLEGDGVKRNLRWFDRDGLEEACRWRDSNPRMPRAGRRIPIEH